VTDKNSTSRPLINFDVSQFKQSLPDINYYDKLINNVLNLLLNLNSVIV